MIGISKDYFDDADFRASLRDALGNLCAAFTHLSGTNGSKDSRALPGVYHLLGCARGHTASLTFYINLIDIKIAPPYLIRGALPGKVVGVAYYSPGRDDFTIVSGPRG
jgi:hypothetical protein